MSFSTEGGIDAWPLERLSDRDIAALGRVPVAAAKALRAQRLVEQRDPRWIEATLERLPAPTLAVLGALCELGGCATHSELATRLGIAGLSPSDVELALLPAAAELLTIPLRAEWGGVSFALIAPAAPRIAAQLVDVASPELPAGTFEDDDGDGRVVAAVAGAMAQLDVKRTIDGHLHKTALKRLIKQLGLDEITIEESIMAALAAGLVREREDQQLRVDAAALEAAALGRYPDVLQLQALAAHLRDGPISHETLASWAARCPPGPGAYLLPSRIARLPGFRAGTVGGVRGLRAAPSAGSASAYVTPSFEVFLPPESRLLDVARVAMMCELVRIDRVIVARITKASIARSGLSADAALSALREACKSPVPQNVELAIADWAHGVTRAAMADGRVIAVAAAMADRTRAALAPFAPRELAPGIFVVARETSPRALAAALARIDIRCDEPIPDAPSAAPRSIPPLAPRASRHRGRVHAWRTGAPFEGRIDDFLERARALNKPAPARQPVVGRAPQGIAQGLAAWERSHRPLPPPVRRVLLAALERVDSVVARTILEARDSSDLMERVRMLVGIPDDDNEDDEDDDDLDGLDWQRDDLRGRLERAVAGRRAMAIDYNGVREIIDLHRVEKHGAAWLVLGAGEDLETVAIPLTAIAAVAELMAPRERWAPAAGQPVPPGHVACPCGSGERYRNCCRAPS